jgi:hypothetical protein
MKESSVTMIGSILWAAAYIASAFVFRHQAVGDWVEGVLLVGWIVFISCRTGMRRSGETRP